MLCLKGIPNGYRLNPFTNPTVKKGSYKLVYNTHTIGKLSMTGSNSDDTTPSYGVEANEPYKGVYWNRDTRTLTFTIVPTYDSETTAITIVDLISGNSNLEIDQIIFGDQTISISDIENIDYKLSNNYDMSSIYVMDYMFANLGAVNIDFGDNFDTSHTTAMRYMFAYSNYYTLDISVFNTTNVFTMESMFRACVNLGLITIGDNFIIGNGTIIDNMFIQVCQENGNQFDIEAPATRLDDSVKYICDNKYSAGLNVSNTYDPAEKTALKSRYVPFGIKTNKNYVYWDNINGALVFRASSDEYVLNSSGVRTTIATPLTELVEDLNYKDSVETHDISFSNVIRIYYDLPVMFKFTERENNITRLDGLYAIIGENVERNNIELIDFGNNFNTNNISSMKAMFDGCRSLARVIFPKIFAQSVSYIDPSRDSEGRIGGMAYMFRNCVSLTSITFPLGFGSGVGNTPSMFENCESLSIIRFSDNMFGDESLGAEYMLNMFKNTGFNNNHIFSIYGGSSNFIGILTNQSTQLSSLGLESVIQRTDDEGETYYECNSNVVEPDEYATNKNYVYWRPDTSSLVFRASSEEYTEDSSGVISIVSTRLRDLIYGGNQLSYNGNVIEFSDVMRIYYDLPEEFEFPPNTSLSELYMAANGRTNNISYVNFGNNFNVSNVTNMSHMFQGCSSLTSVDLSRFTFGGGSFNMSYMFSGCTSLTEVNLNGFTVNSGDIDMSWMFKGCSSLTEVDLSRFVTASSVSMTYMFQNCTSLTSVIFPISSITVSTASYMFSGCTSLTEVNLNGLFTTTSDSFSMYGMFHSCTSLTSVDLSGFTISVSSVGMSQMFYNCRSLTSVNLSGFTVTGSISMSSMFSDCSSLESVSFPTSSITVSEMSYMFSGCSSLESVDLSGFTGGGNMSFMFQNCRALTTIRLWNSFALPINRTNMFKTKTTFNLYNINTTAATAIRSALENVGLKSISDNPTTDSTGLYYYTCESLT